MYNKGDEVLIKGRIDNIFTNNIDVFNANVYIEHSGIYVLDQKSLQPLEEKPLTWRDEGKPLVREPIYWKYPEDKSMFYAKWDTWGIWEHDKWVRVQWLPAEEFPMPAEPEVIEPCPVCHSACAYDHTPFGKPDDNDWRKVVRCTVCGYRGVELDAHNALSRKVQG